jgi:hypothetical protein
LLSHCADLVGAEGLLWASGRYSGRYINEAQPRQPAGVMPGLKTAGNDMPARHGWVGGLAAPILGDGGNVPAAIGRRRGGQG